MGMNPQPGPYPPNAYAGQPMQYGGYGYAPPHPRPRSVTVIAVIGIVITSLMLLGGLCGTVSTLWLSSVQRTMTNGLSAPGFKGNPMAAAMWSNPMLDSEIVAYTVAAAVVGIVLAFVGLFGSIGCLGLKPGGRTTMNVFAVAALVTAAVRMAATIFWMGPKMERMMAQMMGQLSGPAGARVPMMPGGLLSGTNAVAAVLYFVLASVFPICALIFLNRPAAKEAFARRPAAAPPGPAVGYDPYGRPYPPQAYAPAYPQQPPSPYAQQYPQPPPTDPRG